MRSKSLLGLLGLLGMCTAAWAADERPVAAEKSTVSRVAGDESGAGGDQVSLDDVPGVPGETVPVQLDPNMYFEKVRMGADGKVSIVADDAEGGVAGPGERIIYQNTLGTYAINFPTNQPVSDDIATTAPDGCNLTRYKFKVLGKVLPGGTGGAYTVNYGLYTNCPLAVGSTNAARDLVRIPGTEGVLNFPDDAPRDIEHIVPFETPVSLPTNVYLGIRFNRGNCGTVVGAPAMIGFSGDIWDFPGFPCNGYLGGFPQLPHASFWTEMYGSTNCPNAFPGYKCSRASGGQALLGANIQGVDDVVLQVNNCQMVGYEVAVKGTGFYTFDLRRACDGQVIAGTERTFQVNVSTQPQLQIARFTFNPPIALNSQSLFLGFKSSSNTSGAIIAGIDPIIGASSGDYFVIGLDGCAPVIPTQGVHGAVHMAITCGGALPLGACCDPHLTECNDGSGTRCNSSADCVAPATCEALCRQTSEMNCPFPPRGQDQRPKWQQGEQCSPDVFPEPCGVAACCRMRLNPNTGQLDEVCENLTKNECEAAPPLDRPRLWQLGEYCGLGAQRCPRNACLGREGSCYVSHPTPGCTDPFCCTDVCTLNGVAGTFCCDVSWDNTCVDFAQDDCERAPGNDQCAPDFPVRGLEGAMTVPYPGSATGSNEKATLDATEPGFCCNTGVGTCLGGEPFGGLPCIVNSDCGGQTCTERVADPGGSALNPIWFKFTIPAGAPNPSSARVDTCSSNSPALDSVLQVFRAQDQSSQQSACRSLAPIACNDDASNCSSTARNSRVCVTGLVPGETYYVLVGSKTENRLGQYRVTLATSCNPPAGTLANDYCHKATNIVDATPATPNESVTAFDTTNATYDCPAEGCVPGSQNDVWFNYTATCTGTATVTTCGGANPNTNLVVYDGGGTSCANACPPGALPMENGCNDDILTGGCGESSKVTINVVQGNCYRIRVADQDGFPAAGNLTITCGPSGIVDCQPNGIPDATDILNCPVGNPDCKDCNNNSIPDFCDIRDGENDCQPDEIPDGCQLVGNDNNGNNVPDECDPDICPGLVGSNPANCLVDARRPHAPNVPGTPQGINSIQMTFGSGCDVAGAVPGNFTVACNPVAAPCPTVSTVGVVGQVVTVNLSTVIPAGNWTCVTHTPTGEQVCVGSLPGDASGNLTVAPADILDIIDNLNGVRVPALTLDHCDMDRSGQCLPADIIAEIDMLNGANGFIVWNAKALPACPNP